MTQPKYKMVYVTFPDREEALRVARTVIDERLAACANLRGEGTSVYVWNGEVQESQEWVVLFKTRAGCLDALKTRVIALHSYDTPCVVAWDLSDGHTAFFEWIDDMTAQS